MPSDSSSETQHDFLTIAHKLEMLSAEHVRVVGDEAASRNVAPSQIAMQKGLLSAVQVDIVDTLSRPKEVIPGYEILDALGQGGMGVVYRARQQNLDRIVALKTVLVSQMDDPNMLARFEQEAMTVAKLRHPNIVAAYDFGRHEGRVYFAMEFVEGEDVAQLLERKNKLDEATAWGLARQAAAGLANAAHSDIVHRDIKPANLLLVEPPEGFNLPAGMPMVKIADFGLAFLAKDVETRTRLTSTNAAVGSPHYMSPEQYNSDTVDFRADIYSLGATVYHMLAGVPPFHDLPLTRIITGKVTGDPPKPLSEYAEVSQGTQDLISALMDATPENRATDYNQLLGRIDEVLDQLGAPNTGAIPKATAKPVSSNETAPTTVFAREDTKRVEKSKSSQGFVWMLIGGVLMIGLLTACYLLFFTGNTSGPYEPGPRNLVPSNQSKPLYNGQDMTDWPVTPIDGQWNSAKDAFGSTAISGTNGMHRRQFPKPNWENYRITAMVWLQNANAAEIHFGIFADGEGAKRTRSVVRVTKEGVQIGQRPSDTGTFKPLASLDSVPKKDDYSTVHIEKQGMDWYVFFGDEFVGAMPVGWEPLAHEFRIVAEDGTVWFHEIEIVKLEPGHGV